MPVKRSGSHAPSRNLRQKDHTFSIENAQRREAEAKRHPMLGKFMAQMGWRHMETGSKVKYFEDRKTSGFALTIGYNGRAETYTYDTKSRRFVEINSEGSTITEKYALAQKWLDTYGQTDSGWTAYRCDVIRGLKYLSPKHEEAVLKNYTSTLEEYKKFIEVHKGQILPGKATI